MNNEKMQKRKKNIILLLLTVLISITLLVIYKSFLKFPFFQYVLLAYMGMLTVLVVVYIIYNRAFSRKGVTVDMLPESWDMEKKEEFVRSGEERLRKSKWMLMLIIAFLFTLVFDAVELYIIANFF